MIRKDSVIFERGYPMEQQIAWGTGQGLSFEANVQYGSHRLRSSRHDDQDHEEIG